MNPERSASILQEERQPSRWTARRRDIAGLALVLSLYLLATLPYLNNFPVVDWPQTSIAAPAYKLASEGVYGNDLFVGFHHTELRNYEYMPAYPILVALSFNWFGFGVTQARLVSVLCGSLTVLLTFALGRRLYGSAAGLTAAAALCLLQLSPLPGTSGIPLLDFARIIRYDILVPVFTLAACLVFTSTLGRQSRSTSHPLEYSWRVRLGLLGTGLYAGLATLSHVYGAFILAVLVVALVWQQGLQVLRRGVLLWMPLGWILAIAPWIVYVAQDVAAYQGQMTRHEGRFALLDVGFYWDNLVREYHRYGAWVGGFPEGLLTPRVGIWFMIAAVGATWLLLWRRSRTHRSLADSLLLWALPVQMLMLGLLLNLKRNVYTVILLPFIALHVGVAVTLAGQWIRRRGYPLPYAVAIIIIGAVVAEGGLAIRRALHAAQRATPYAAMTQAIADTLAPGARLLISQPYWFGLTDFETRSINLVYVQRHTTPMEHVIREFDPDYVILEREFLDDGLSPQEEVRRWWREFHDYLLRYCPDIIFTLPAPGYGTIDIWSCRSTTPAH